jgi:hypothetical protein
MRENEEQFLNQSLEFWQPHSPRLLNREDARQIAENLTSFFRIISEWNFAERRTAPQAIKSLSKDIKLAGKNKDE